MNPIDWFESHSGAFTALSALASAIFAGLSSEWNEAETYLRTKFMRGLLDMEVLSMSIRKSQAEMHSNCR